MSRVIIVRHHEGDLDDTASLHLASGNYHQVEHWYPFSEGDSVTLPALHDVSGTIIMGGAQNVTELDQYSYLEREIDWINTCIAANLPIVGICLGSQLLAHALGGKVAKHPDGICEFGYETILPVAGNDWITEPIHMMQAHFQGFEFPPNTEALATGTHFPCQAFRYKSNVFGFQFHPEVHSDMFKQWQQADWRHEFNAMPGACPPEQQHPANEKYNAAQTRWFTNFLDRLFPPLSG